MISLRFPVFTILALAIGLSTGPRPSAAQDPAKKDEALEKLLEKLDDPKPAAPASTDPSKKPDAKPPSKPDPAKKDDGLEKLLEKLDESKSAPAPSPAKPEEPGKPDAGKPPKAGEVGSKDQSLDKLLEGLGGSNDKPAPDDKKQGGGAGPGDEPPQPAKGGGNEAKPDKLDDASKKLDDLLEEKTGRKPKKRDKPGQQGGQGQGQGQGGDEGEAGGPMGDLIKQMREVEDRLGKPDTGAETRKKQTEIVKNLDTLLEQMKSSSQGQAMKLVRGGQKPGGPPQPGQGNQPGATGQGVGATKPTPPKTPPKPVELAKEVWGQLPAQFRDDMANVLNENPLPTKADLIRLYYISLGKKSASKGD